MGDYVRVLPRDLFNEAGLLKCIGTLWIALDETGGHSARIEEEDVPRFDIVQDAGGGLTVANLTFTIGGVPHRLMRPLNSRESWALFVEECEGDPDFDPVRVFDGVGRLSDDMRRLIGAA